MDPAAPNVEGRRYVRLMVATRPFGPAGEFAASRHGAFTRSQAATSGLTPKTISRLLRDAVLAEPVPGVLVVVGSPATWHQRLYVATLASNHAGAAAVRSAAALAGMDGHPPGPLEILVPNSRRIDLPDLVVRRGPFDDEDLHEVDGIRCTGIARTLCDLGSIVDSAKLKLAFEWAWRNGTSLLWMERTALRLDRPRNPGPRMLLELIDGARRGGKPTESALEVKVEHVIGSLPGLVRQHIVTAPTGEFIARVDFAIPELKIAIEAHSRERHFTTDAILADGEREEALQADGWIVRFVTEAHRRRPEALRTSLLALIAARTADRSA